MSSSSSNGSGGHEGRKPSDSKGKSTHNATAKSSSRSRRPRSDERNGRRERPDSRGRDRPARPSAESNAIQPRQPSRERSTSSTASSSSTISSSSSSSGFGTNASNSPSSSSTNQQASGTSSSASGSRPSNGARQGSNNLFRCYICDAELLRSNMSRHMRRRHAAELAEPYVPMAAVKRKECVIPVSIKHARRDGPPTPPPTAGTTSPATPFQQPGRCLPNLPQPHFNLQAPSSSDERELDADLVPAPSSPAQEVTLTQPMIFNDVPDVNACQKSESAPSTSTEVCEAGHDSDMEGEESTPVFVLDDEMAVNCENVATHELPILGQGAEIPTNSVVMTPEAPETLAIDPVNIVIPPTMNVPMPTEHLLIAPLMLLPIIDLVNDEEVDEVAPPPDRVSLMPTLPRESLTTEETESSSIQPASSDLMTASLSLPVVSNTPRVQPSTSTAPTDVDVRGESTSVTSHRPDSTPSEINVPQVVDNESAEERRQRVLLGFGANNSIPQSVLDRVRRVEVYYL